MIKKKNFLDWLFIVIAWVIASFSITSTGVFFQSIILRFIDFPLTPQNQEYFAFFTSGFQYVEGTLFGVFFGSVFYAVHWLSENTTLRQRSYGTIMVVKTLMYFIGFVLAFLLIFSLLIGLKITPVGGVDDLLITLGSWRFYLAFGFFLTLFSVIINFVLEVSKKYGPGNLWHMFTGKYHKPVIENRIFMFLDLKDSTTYAEKLGHIRYSRLIQTCFRYLNEIVFSHKAQIYQYVGDEAVLTWDAADPEAAALCVDLFFAFRRKLESKALDFEKDFGFVPEFKAGINKGPVTAAEVGYIKREIAYHGDVLNTGARIQSMCNAFGKSLLVSEIFAQQTRTLTQFKQELIGEITLKGKAQAVNIYAMEKN